MLVAESLMMTIAAVIPNFFWGIILWAATLGVFMLVSGFFRLTPDLPAPVWRYPLHYVSPDSWWYEGYLLNEFDGHVFAGANPGLAPGSPSNQAMTAPLHTCPRASFLPPQRMDNETENAKENTSD